MQRYRNSPGPWTERPTPVSRTRSCLRAAALSGADVTRPPWHAHSARRTPAEGAGADRIGRMALDSDVQGAPHPSAFDRSRAIGARRVDHRQQRHRQGGGFAEVGGFYNEGHRLIYEHINRLAVDNHPADAVTVSESLRAAGKLTTSAVSPTSAPSPTPCRRPPTSAAMPRSCVTAR